MSVLISKILWFFAVKIERSLLTNISTLMKRENYDLESNLTSVLGLQSNMHVLQYYGGYLDVTGQIAETVRNGKSKQLVNTKTS